MSGYIGNIPVPQATQTRQSFTATASQTTFNTAGYSPGYIDVFLNGVKLAPADYTATNGSDVVLAVGAASGDILETVAYEIFQVLDQDFTGDFTVDGSTFVVDSTNNRVGIGTTSPTANLDIKRTSGDNDDIIRIGSTDNYYLGISRSNTTGAFSFQGNQTGFNDIILAPTSGNVGIGTSSPSAKLDLQGTAAGDEMLEITHSGASQPWKFTSGESGVTNESLRISRGASGEWMRFHAGLGTVFYHDGTERMRIDSSGNLLVDTTSTSIVGSGGFAAKPQGSGVRLDISNSGGATMLLDRRTNDGEIISFYKDGSGVGSIGTGSGVMAIAGPSGNGLSFPNNLVLPSTSSAGAKDASTDLGVSYSRFKDLYLSGGVFLGGTGSSNKLDDYEEGTWTPILRGDAGDATANIAVGYYTKIGRNVTLIGSYTWSSNGSNTVTNTRLAGFPFTSTSASNCRGAGVVGAVTGIADSDGLVFAVDPNNADAYLINREGSIYNHNNTVSGSGAIYGFCINYITDA